MASLHRIKGRGRSRKASFVVRICRGEDDRPSIHLGAVGRDDAESIRKTIGRLHVAKLAGGSIAPSDAAWLATVSDDLHGRLADLGLAEARTPKTTCPTLQAWADRYIGERAAELKPASMRALRLAATKLVSHFGGSVQLDAVTPDGAAAWRAALLAEGLAEASVRCYARYARQLYAAAVARELARRNPFTKIPTASKAAVRARCVTAVEAARIIETCPDVQAKALFALARMAGLRTPSETHRLRWADVDMERGRLHVHAAKTERYAEHATRIVPIVPALRNVLAEAFTAAPVGSEHVITLPADQKTLHRRIGKIVALAGVEPWPRLFQTLRQSCETEWAGAFPQHAVSRWMGHSVAVSIKHYLSVPDELLDRAAGSKSACQIAHQNAPDLHGNRAEPTPDVTTPESAETPENPWFSEVSETAPPRARTLDPLIKSQLPTPSSSPPNLRTSNELREPARSAGPARMPDCTPPGANYAPSGGTVGDWLDTCPVPLTAAVRAAVVRLLVDGEGGDVGP